MRRILFALLRVGVGIGLLAYLVESKAIDLRVLARLISAWPISLLAIVLLLLDLGLMAWRLCLLFRARGMPLAFAMSLQLTSLSSFFATFLPGRAGGDLAKVFYASRENSGRRTEIVTILLLDRALGLFSLLLLPLAIAPLLPGLPRVAAVRISLSIVSILAIGMLTGFLVCLFAPVLVNRLMEGPLKSLPGRALVVRSLSTIAAYRGSLWSLAAALGISLADNLMAIGILALGLLIVNPASLEAKLLVMVPMGEIVNSLPLTPGGLGVGETAFNAFFSIAGMRGGAEALLCWRVWNALVGLLGLFFYLRGIRVRIFDSYPASPVSNPGA
jgi:glycosyltransferase 2 family protein